MRELHSCFLGWRQFSLSCSRTGLLKERSSCFPPFFRSRRASSLMLWSSSASGSSLHNGWNFPGVNNNWNGRWVLGAPSISATKYRSLSSAFWITYGPLEFGSSFRESPVVPRRLRSKFVVNGDFVYVNDLVDAFHLPICALGLRTAFLMWTMLFRSQ